MWGRRASGLEENFLKVVDDEAIACFGYHKRLKRERDARKECVIQYFTVYKGQKSVGIYNTQYCIRCG